MKAGIGAFPLGTRLGDGVPSPPLAIEGQDWGPAPPRVAPERVLQVDLRGASAARVDLRRAGFTGRRAVTVKLTTDGAATLRATGGGRCVAVTAATVTCRLAPARR